MHAHRKLMKQLKKPYFTFVRERYQQYGLKNLKKNRPLFQTLTTYLERSKSTGCDYYDYWFLYDYIRRYNPREILECGTGASTLVMAFALMENVREGKDSGRITSMEDVEFWYRHSRELIPGELNPYIDLIYSPKTEFSYSIFRGVGYREIPERAFQFAFIDGPEATAPSDNAKTFNLDLINVVRKSEQPIFAVVDKRVSTCYVFQKVFGAGLVKFNPRCDLGFVGPVTRRDLKSKIGTGSFSHGFRLVGNSRLDFVLKSPAEK